VGFTNTCRLEGDRLAAALREEWLLTNGLGGFAMGTVGGWPERRYHAWLTAAASPPVGRFAALAACAEWLVIPNGPDAGRHDLSTFQFCDGTRSPNGAAALVAFERCSSMVQWTYAVARRRVTRALWLGRNQNALAVTYVIDGQPIPGAFIEARPLFALRDFHALNGGASHHADAGFRAEHGMTTVATRRGIFQCTLRVDGAWRDDPQWWRNFSYAKDADRAQDCAEDLYSPGVFTLDSPSTSPTARITAWADATAPTGDDLDADRERKRVALLAQHTVKSVRATGEHERRIAALTAAADKFVARRGTDGVTIIAGFPWFADWGRDLCIALPGIFLTTGRVEEAGKALAALAAARRNGLVPNTFDNASGQPEYNTVDASLWFVVACCEFARAAGPRERDLLESTLLPACLDIAHAYRDGTDFGIKLDPADGLITAGDETTQLTWMDARRDGVVFTPRHGKAVEINALWHAALTRLAPLVSKRDGKLASALAELAERCKASFEPAFWNARAGCLSDVLTPAGGAWTPDPLVRPNQIFAVSLGRDLLSSARAQAVVEACTARLLTPVGLRTLAPGESGYCPHYRGSLFERDRAYHNGTVWPWLLGPYCEALLRVNDFSKDARARVLALLAPLADMLASSPTLSTAEVYDAEPPRRPEGCPAQAWSVAEILRVYAMTLGEPAA